MYCRAAGRATASEGPSPLTMTCFASLPVTMRPPIEDIVAGADRETRRKIDDWAGGWAAYHSRSRLRGAVV